MEDTASVYNNQERKREIVASLNELQNILLKAGENLEGKAWQILSVTSATFGIVSAILTSLVSAATPALFWIGLAIVLLLYLFQVYHIIQATKPVKWDIAPGMESYEKIMQRFVAQNGVALTDDEYLNQVIADFAGNIDIKDGKTEIFGSIQKLEVNNQQKAKHIQLAALLLGIITASLIGFSFAVAVTK